MLEQSTIGYIGIRIIKNQNQAKNRLHESKGGEDNNTVTREVISHMR